MKAADKYLPDKEQVLGFFLFIVFLVFYWRVIVFLFYNILPSNHVTYFLSWVAVLANFPFSALTVRYVFKWIRES
ncbi:hypothetical protein N780_08920 [Pontibacillus chungwhensis BH030062]|uniref:Uncharacterized protein n=1 Tax=Pontibacillus chungwhensis BH030062 TaxID=1385513 RepID=A0A0A2UXZ2_9BACI|nr:hypothetical protein [Pontibacillus chungwhensis]KGP91351.1 hypothetical protein N780_08920 [Pontibacillus chungwhensis BH030062]